jgi:hypothetical protein
MKVKTAAERSALLPLGRAAARLDPASFTKLTKAVVIMVVVVPGITGILPRLLATIAAPVMTRWIIRKSWRSKKRDDHRCRSDAQKRAHSKSFLVDHLPTPREAPASNGVRHDQQARPHHRTHL